MQNKIYLRYIKWIIAILFTMLIMIGALIYYIEQKNIIIVNKELCEKVTNQIKNTLQYWIKDQLRMIEMISNEDAVIEALLHPDDNDKVMNAHSYLKKIHDRYPYYENIPLVIRLSNNKTVKVNINGEEKQVSNGQIFIDTVDSKTIGKAGLHISWVQSAFAGKKFFISEVYPSILRGNPIFVISSPVIKDNKILGAAVIAPQMDYFTKLFVDNITIGKTGYLAVFDERGMIISYPERDMILNKESIEKTKHITNKLLNDNYDFYEKCNGVKKRIISCKTDIPSNIIKYQWYITSFQDKQEIMESSNYFLKILVYSSIIFFIVIALIIFTLTRMIFLKPIEIAFKTVHRLSNFDLTVTINEISNDEFGEMLKALNIMIQEFRKVVGDVTHNGKILVSSSKLMTKNINTIASATHQMNLKVGNVSDTAKDMSQNINTVASAIEEMSMSIKEVEKNARKGFDIASEAVIMADNAGQAMSSLDRSADEIGEVTEVIKRIADKTTLLALNADIEAASAGEAGKGFAVVANEIKDFAHQSTRAADDIANKISSMQKNTEQAVKVIKDITNIIDTINASSETISKALDEQMKTANEIASNAVQGNERANDIANSIVELADGADEIAKSVGMAARGEYDGKDEADKHMNTSAVEVARLAKHLLNIVEKFKI